MEPRPTFFPVFVSGQYLTSENLNETQDFLWQEEKATRYLLNGNGIATGLNPDFTDSTLLKQVTITAGQASTSDGYLIQAGNQSFDKGFSIQLSLITLPDGTEQLMEKAAFDKVKANLNATEIVLNAIEVFHLSDQIANLPDGTKTLNLFNITPAQALSTYITLAWVYINDTESDNCMQGDCNIKGIHKNYTTRYFLVPNTLLPPSNFASPEMPLCIAARIKNLSQAGSITGFNAASFTAFGANVTELQPYFSLAATGKQLGLIAGLLGAAEQASYTNAIVKFTQVASSVSVQNCPQYYNAFAADLSKAINELVSFYNDYAKKYPTYLHTRIEGTAILGSFRQTGVDNWRYYFIPAADQVQFMFDRKKLSTFFMRAVALVNNFVLQPNIIAQAAKVNKPLFIPTVAGDALLQNRAIPYYYDVLLNGAANDILRNWNPHGGNLQNIFCYYDAVIPTRNSNPNMAAKLAAADWSNQGFFRLEGHVGLPIASAISLVNALVVNDGLPIQVLDCDVNYTGPIKWNTWYGQFVTMVNAGLASVRATKNAANYAYDPLKKIATATLETSYRQPDQIKVILNDFTAYSHVFYSAATKNAIALKGQKISDAKGKFKKTNLAATPVFAKDVINNYVNNIKQDALILLIKNYNDAITDLTSATTKKLIVLKDLAGLEYSAGTPRGGTVFLLHSNGIVVGDGSLPYYYRIDQARVFSQ